jgi:hypothetical protein
VQNILNKLLDGIIPCLETKFAITDKKGHLIYGGDMEKAMQSSIRICGAKFTLLADIPPSILKDFGLLVEDYINTRLGSKILDCLLGKENPPEGFPFPCGLLLIKSPGKLEDLLYELFKTDLIFSMPDTTLLVILQLDNLNELKEISQALLDSINEELCVKTIISIGRISHSWEEMSMSFKEAQKALDFAPKINSSIVSYNDMIFERLLLSIPNETRKNFVNEIKQKLDLLDKDTRKTIRVVLDCNLNMSEAARKLYIHRNTLMYRLDKIANSTGLDLRNFKDAVKMEIFKEIQ